MDENPSKRVPSTIRVDGALHATTATTVLEALRGLGIDVPTLCHDDRLRPLPVCRLCVVEVDGAARPACATEVREGMTIRTRSEAIDGERRLVLAGLAQHLPAALRSDPEPVPFFVRLDEAGLAGALGGDSDLARVDDAHPYIRIDLARCIDCHRCVRICDEVQGLHVWNVFGRGAATEVRPGTGGTLLESGCVSCGACVTSCPTGALDDKTRIERGPATGRTRTTCPYCGVGCEIDVRTRGGRIVQVLPVLDAPVNRGHLCSKGRYAFGFVEAPDRVTAPLVRENGAFRAIDWPEAIAVVAARFRAILAQHGPGAVAILGSARATNEENYVAQKLARVVFGTNNVDSCARVCHAPSATALVSMFGAGAATASYDDIELARTILVCGANATESHPIVGARIRHAARRGAALIVVDPRATDLAREPGAIHLALRPGTNVALFLAMAQVILEEGLFDPAFVAERVDGVEALRAHVAAFRPEEIAGACDVEPDLVRRAARTFATKRPSISFHGLGLTEHPDGTDAVSALTNLALLTGNVGRPGTGVNPLRGQNNVQGAAHMGCEPGRITGYVPIDTAAPTFEARWGAPVPRAPGLRLLDMIDQARAGHVRAMWILGYEVALTNPDARHTRSALGALDFLVVQDLFLSETARSFAHVVLPAASSFEKDGTFMNAERRVQRVRKALEPPGKARPDWQPLCAVAAELGHREQFAYAAAEDIWEEIREVWPAGRGITYARLERGGVQWPCPDEAHPGTRRLHETSFAAAKRAVLACVTPTPSGEVPSRAYPFLLMTGRASQAFNAGTMTGRTEHHVLRPADTVDIAPVDAARLGIDEGASVVVESQHGVAALRAHVDAALRPGELFATFHEPSSRTNDLVGTGVDRAAGTPEYKRVAVRLRCAPR